MNRVPFCFQCCAVAVVCWLGVNTAFGDTSSGVTCRNIDDRIGVCQVQFLLYTQSCTQGVSVECSWGNIFDPEQRGLICRTIFQDRCWDVSTRVTAWVRGETNEERKDRIVRHVDDFVAFGVRDLKYFQCDMRDKEGNPVGIMDANDCQQLEDAYPGLIAYPGRIEYPADELNLTSIGHKFLNTGRYRSSTGTWAGFSVPATLGSFYPGGARTGSTRIDVREIQFNWNLYLYSVVVNKDSQIVDTTAHERIHLADRMDNGVLDWGGANEIEHNKQMDRVHKQGERIAELLGNTSRVDWSRGCHPPYEPLFWLEGWGHDMADGNHPNYCRIGEVIQH